MTTTPARWAFCSAGGFRVVSGLHALLRSDDTDPSKVGVFPSLVAEEALQQLLLADPGDAEWVKSDFCPDLHSRCVSIADLIRLTNTSVLRDVGVLRYITAITRGF